MRYFGVPTCPYCKKRVNLIRTWSLKRQGEYVCPRCGGTSNIYLSPLIYVLAMLAVFSGGVLYFFHKYILDDISLETAVYVFIPFAFFFLFSLFMVYLEKPVIKRVSRAEYKKKGLFHSEKEDALARAQSHAAEYFDDEDYVARGAHRPGPSPQPQDSGVVNQRAFDRARQQAAMENDQISQRIHMPGAGAPAPSPAQRPQTQQPVRSAQAAARPAQATARPVQPRTGQTVRPVQRTPQSAVQQGINRPAVYSQAGQGRAQGAPQQGTAVRSAQPVQNRQYTGTARPTSGVHAPLNERPPQGRYDDSAYLQRRISQMERENRRRDS